jgi:hypothetical protein
MIKDNHNCSVCRSNTKALFELKVLKKYIAGYYLCSNCGLIQTEKPYWLNEAYKSVIIDSDTGIISRNITLSKITAIIHILFLNKKSKVLDYAGGYGILTRMLRDIGVDCYWTDKYAKNIFARGFGDMGKVKYDMVTAFELFEHLENPVKEISDIVKKFKPKMLLFSTMLHNGNPSKDWWYFVPEGGQHVSFYTQKCLKILANKIGMKLSTNGRNIHIFSRRQIPGLFMKIISVFWPIISVAFPVFFKSKTFSDRLKVVASK